MFASFFFFFFKQMTAYEMRISDWSSVVCSSDLRKTRRAVDRLRASRQCRRCGRAWHRSVDRVGAVQWPVAVTERRLQRRQHQQAGCKQRDQERIAAAEHPALYLERDQQIGRANV